MPKSTFFLVLFDTILNSKFKDLNFNQPSQSKILCTNKYLINTEISL